jgi:hypothetical protein
VGVCPARTIPRQGDNILISFLTVPVLTAL